MLRLCSVSTVYLLCKGSFVFYNLVMHGSHGQLIFIIAECQLNEEQKRCRNEFSCLAKVP